MEERMKKRGDSFQDEDLFGDLDSGDPILEQVTVGGTEETVSMEEEMLDYESGEAPVLLEKEPVPPGNYFKLGEEGGFRQYENQYSLVQHALSRNQVLQCCVRFLCIYFHLIRCLMTLPKGLVCHTNSA